MKVGKHKGTRKKWAATGGKVIVVIDEAVAYEGSSRIEAWAFMSASGAGVAYCECRIPWPLDQKPPRGDQS